jgi:phosphate transport system permease protein
MVIMTITAPPQAPTPQVAPDVPITINRSRSKPDVVFQGVLAASSLVVLLIMLATVLFLAVHGWSTLREAGFGLITDATWNPDRGDFGVMPLLVGSIGIAVVALVIALPVSLSTALMINEYAPARLRGVLTGTVDLLATIPSIVYGFWGLEYVSGLQVAPAKWIVDHFSFVPIFRTPSPGQYASSIFACGLICSLTIIPIITSISRDVMSQTPRDACEAALGLGGTRWGMVTDVILPFSRNGILGAALLGFGRGLGETMIVVLVLSPANILTVKIMGPGGLGSIAKQITEDFETGDTVTKSALILAGLVLFMATLAVNFVARMIVERSTT